MPANVALIKQRLFDRALEPIARDYNLGSRVTADQLVQGVLESLDQLPVDAPLNQQCDNSVVFRAVVRALGSNNRKWTTFTANEVKIEEMLSGFDLGRIAKERPHCFELARLLPGTTATADACAILHWAHRLHTNVSYYAAQIVNASSEIQNTFRRKVGRAIEQHELFLCVVAHFTDPSKARRDRKWPGMGFPLGSEFLRNLHWNGFKPDRHLKRLLLERWTTNQINVQDQLKDLRTVISWDSPDLTENLKCSLIGMQIAPDDFRSNLSQFDNLIWLLGAYVEKKGGESAYDYMLS